MQVRQRTPREDLEASGLSQETIALLKISHFKEDSPSGPLQGYIIPYFDFNGALSTGEAEFHRKRLLPPLTTRSGKTVKYLQPKGSGTHIYIPPNSPGPVWWFDKSQPLVFTEGEKKSIKACQEGIPTLGLGGINNWRVKTIDIPGHLVTPTGLGNKNGKISYTIDVNDNSPRGILNRLTNPVCPELLEIPFENREVYIVADTDQQDNPNIQLSVFEFYMWLLSQGARCRQIILPNLDTNLKVGLDDFLIEASREDLSPYAVFWDLPKVHPERPDVRKWVTNELGNPKKGNSRSSHIKVAHAVVNGLDARGQRYVDPYTKSYYYYDQKSNVLHEFHLDSSEIKQLRLNTFGNLLGTDYNVGSNDAAVLSRIADIFVGREGLHSIIPRRVSYSTANTLYYQLSDSYVAKVTSDYIEVVENGTDDVLFLANQVEPINTSDLTSERGMTYQPKATDEPRWITILKSVNLQPLYGFSLEETQTLLSGLFYLSPLFRRWRGLMLPLELCIAEPGSGKTFLYNLRKLVLTGQPSLDNPPMSSRDWYTQLTSSGAMWVCDNFGTPPKDLEQHMSDELARLITDPSPKIEMRKLYTTATLSSHPIDCTFSITAIRNPFYKGDLIERSLPIYLKAIRQGSRDSDWYNRMLANVGGRPHWVLEQLHMAKKFLRAVELHWNPDYLSDNRLVHFEQSLLLMGVAMGNPYTELMQSALSKFPQALQHQIAASDPVMECLEAFCFEVIMNNKSDALWKAKDIVSWVQLDPDQRYLHVRVTQNPISLGHYISSHEHNIRTICGLSSIRRHNQTLYKVTPQGNHNIRDGSIE